MIEQYLKRISRHVAVYWSRSTVRSDGSFSYNAPVEIKCFWSPNTKLTTVEKEGKVISIMATVHVTQDLSEQAILYLGTLSSLTTLQQSDPRKVSGAYEITMFIKEPSLYLLDTYNRRALITPRKTLTR
jgi:hypothetical protein